MDVVPWSKLELFPGGFSLSHKHPYDFTWFRSVVESVGRQIASAEFVLSITGSDSKVREVHLSPAQFIEQPLDTLRRIYPSRRVREVHAFFDEPLLRLMRATIAHLLWKYQLSLLRFLPKDNLECTELLQGAMQNLVNHDPFSLGSLTLLRSRLQPSRPCCSRHEKVQELGQIIEELQYLLSMGIATTCFSLSSLSTVPASKRANSFGQPHTCARRNHSRRRSGAFGGGQH